MKRERFLGAVGTGTAPDPACDRFSSRPGRQVVCKIQGVGLLILYSRMLCVGAML